MHVRFCCKTDDGQFLELQWDETWATVASNANGSSGWARVLRSSGGTLSEGACRRVHKCARNPCTARWPASKYGLMGAPIHVQEVSSAEATFGPAPPAGAALHAGHIPPPIAAPSPQLRIKATCGLERGSGNLHEIIFQLGREIRTTRAYVGYSFFVLLALARSCRPFVWEGSNRVDLVGSYTPWAVDTAVAECAVDGIACCMRSLPDGRVEMVEVSEDHPLHEC